MKNLFALLAISISLSCFSQERVNYTGLNSSIPDNIELGVKTNINFYFAKHTAIADGSDQASEDKRERPGFGVGAYGHFMFTEHVGLQTEVNLTYRRGFTTSYREFDLDTARFLNVEEVSSYSTFGFEIPVYLKFHWGFDHLNNGNWKSKTQLGLFMGPRLLLTPSSNRTLSRASTTNVYDEISLSVENDITAPSDYNSSVGVGIAIGADYELWNGFALHIACYRGLTSHVNKLNGFKAMDNRIEFGVGYRFM
ncbi:MAG: outer membrane beta-barrel protein [Crocinitomicaceae bacterium]|nr:outer membrane beta-barrel protein [Crocinitomicaceae bacterium]